MWLRCLQSEHQDGGSVWRKYPSDSERGERHCWWQMGFFKKLLIHWYFHTGTTSRCVYVFGSNIKKPLDLGKVDHDLFFALGNSPPSLLSSWNSRENASVGVDIFQWSCVSVFSVSFTLLRGRPAAICHLSRTCEASRTLKRAGRIVLDPSWPRHNLFEAPPPGRTVQMTRIKAWCHNYIFIPPAVAHGHHCPLSALYLLTSVIVLLFFLIFFFNPVKHFCHFKGRRYNFQAFFIHKYFLFVFIFYLISFSLTCKRIFFNYFVCCCFVAYMHSWQ